VGVGALSRVPSIHVSLRRTLALCKALRDPLVLGVLQDRHSILSSSARLSRAWRSNCSTKRLRWCSGKFDAAITLASSSKRSAATASAWVRVWYSSCVNSIGAASPSRLLALAALRLVVRVVVAWDEAIAVLGRLHLAPALVAHGRLRAFRRR